MKEVLQMFSQCSFYLFQLFWVNLFAKVSFLPCIPKTTILGIGVLRSFIHRIVRVYSLVMQKVIYPKCYISFLSFLELQQAVKKIFVICSGCAGRKKRF